MKQTPVHVEPSCLFCRIVDGTEPSHKVWEDADHLAFLSLFPNTQGTTVVIPKQHFESYAFGVPENVLIQLIKASRKVATTLDDFFPAVGRTAMILEGFGINHLHSKLFPLHNTAFKHWRPVRSQIDTFFEKYEGYVSSHDSQQASHEDLAQLAKKIREHRKLG